MTSANTISLSPANSHKTAIKRISASSVARKLHERGILTNLGIRSILDFGCGYAADVEFYRSIGYEADGFDIEPRFGRMSLGARLYDLVTLVFVVNVLSTPEARVSAVREASRFVRPGGHMVIAARSVSAILAEARKRSWKPFGDGWISSPTKGTFQKGISEEEIKSLLGAFGLSDAGIAFKISSDVAWLLGSSAGSPVRR